MVAVEDHVHTLENEALAVAFEGQDALAAQNVRTLFLHQILHPWEKFIRVQRLVALQRNRLHLLVVIVLETAVRMRVRVAMILTMVIVVVAMVMIVAVVMIVAFEKS